MFRRSRTLAVVLSCTLVLLLTGAAVMFSPFGSRNEVSEVSPSYAQTENAAPAASKEIMWTSLNRFMFSRVLHARDESLADSLPAPLLVRVENDSDGVSTGSGVMASAPMGSGNGNVPHLLVQKPYTGPPINDEPVEPVKSPPLNKMPPIPPLKRGEPGGRELREPPKPPDLPDSKLPTSSFAQTFPGSSVSAPSPGSLAFDGVGVGVGGFSPSSNPPDVNGRVGATQFVQWNNTSFGVFNKTTGALIYGPAAGKTLFQSLGGICAAHDDGDPVVSYDTLAGRWILSQFVVDGPAGSASHQCIAVSATQDATGSYYLYDFLTDGTNFVDYPHTGVWPDGYYMSAHVFNAAGTAQVAARIYVFERDKMILGQAARMQVSDLPKDGGSFQYGFLPADLDSLTPPPAGSQEYVLGPNGQFTNRTDISRVAVTWGTTPTMTLTSSTNTAVGVGNAPCVSNTAGTGHRDCVPQAGAALGANVPTDDLDNLSLHFMYRLAYRNNGGTQSIVASGPTAGAVTVPAHGAISWMEWRGAAGSAAPTLFQSGTYDPTSATSDYRWMPSIAMDNDGNIALGYSKSSNTTRPSIWISGRLSTDTAGTMGAEALVQAGGGVQTAGGGNRWGDYSSMTVDPVDQCTFWYTNEYLKTDGNFNWSTRVATYKFPSCTAAAVFGTLSGTITSSATGAPIQGATVTLNNGYSAATDAAGHYSLFAPSGTYTAIAADDARNCSAATPSAPSVTISVGATTTQNYQLSGTSKLQGGNTQIDDSGTGNANGVINRNECVTVNLGVKNVGCATETNTTSTLTTTTPGVTVTQASSAYPDLVIDASSNDLTPFKIQTSSSFICGTPIALALSTTSTGGSALLNYSLPTCGGGPNQSIPSSQLTTADTSQNDREGRTGAPSDCSVQKPAPGGGFSGTHRYKTFTFTNTSGSATCFTVTINAAAGGPGDIESVAYDQTYNPASIDTNYLGDSGISGLGTTVTSASYSFMVPAGHNFVVVVNQTGTTLSGVNASSVFSGTVSGFVNNNAGPGACAVATPTTLTASPATGPFNGTVNLSATLTNGANPISGKSVAFTLNGNSVGSTSTNASGVATLSNVSLAGISAGTYPTGVGANFAGDASFATSGGTAQLTVNPPPTVQFGSATFAGAESRTAVITVTRTGDLSVSSSVNAATVAGGNATAGASCTGSADYIPANSVLSFGSGEGSKILNVSLCGDTSVDPNETANLSLTSPSGATLGSQSTAVLTILDTASVFTNPTPISLNIGAQGSVYPSQVTISGASNLIGSMRVTLYDVSHINPDNLDVMLVAPGGIAYMLMSDSGGANAIDPTSPVTLTFIDSASQVLPNSAALTSGTFLPTTWEANSTPFTSPAPASFNQPGSATSSRTSTQTLNGTFASSNPNGAWSLYVRDDNGAPFTEAVAGNIGGWGLQVFGPTAADVSLSGRITDANGYGLRNALIQVADTQGHIRTARTNAFGYYSFDSLVVGQPYILTPSARGYTFAPRLVQVFDSLTSVDFAPQ